jgi:hypothetical protein
MVRISVLLLGVVISWWVVTPATAVEHDRAVGGRSPARFRARSVAVSGRISELPYGAHDQVLITLRHSPLLLAALRRPPSGLRRRAGPRDLNADASEHQEQQIAHVIRELGGTVLEYDVLTGSLRATVPRRGIAPLSHRADVAAIERVAPDHLLGLEISTSAIGAPSFWAAGFSGGRGSADSSSADLAILHDKIEEGHPAFAGVTFQRPADAPSGTECGQYVNGCEHGTEVASMAITRSAANCECNVSARNGVAPGLHSVLDAEAASLSVDEKAWALGVGSFGIPGAADPAEAMSDSHGAPANSDDSGGLQRTDKLISAYGTLIAYPAGNEGPQQTVNQNCIAYDTLCMGGFDHRGTVDPSDDMVEDFSSRGPTPGGRKKPDLVAVSTSEFANQHWIRDGRLWSGGSGTSLAAPQGAAAAALLAGSGIAAPIAQKAILIDSARQGRATPSSPMGTQAGWQPDWGWGALDLDGALKERTNFYMREVAGGDAHFYRAKLQSPGDRATLVWNRRALGCIAPGCDTTSLTLSNLNLEQLDPATGAVEASSASAIDNVEQVRSPGAGDVIYKVKAASTVDGLPGEPYALAARRQVTPLGTPRPNARVQLSATEVRPGEPVQVLADVTNPSADLSGESATATIDLPPGVALAPGSNPTTQPLGTLGPSASATVAWTVRADGDALNHISVHTQASRYGETFGSDGNAAFRSDGTAPTAGISAPAGTSEDTAIPVSWAGTDTGAGVRDFDVEISANDGPYVPWLTATSSTSATYAGTPGTRYRFRVRAADRLGNTSPYVISDEVRVLDTTAEHPVAPPPDPPAKSSPGLRVRTIARHGARIQVVGTLSRRAVAPITFSLRGRVGRRPVKRSAKTFPQAGRFEVSLRVPRGTSGILTIRYEGDDALSAAGSRIRLRRL